jgi:hypothetical protein
VGRERSSIIGAQLAHHVLLGYFVAVGGTMVKDHNPLIG